MKRETLGGRFAIVRELGAGGMGVVYEAVQLDLERTVAIKVLPPEAAGDAKAGARLRQEAMAAARLGHPNVVEVFELGTADDGSPFIVMERLVGTSLRDVLLEQRRMTVDRAVRIALQMLDALGAAHAVAIVHRDVKPGNVMLLEDDRVKLVDFGIARFSEDERSVRTTTGTLLGTPAYLAPEQIDGRGVDARTDLHAVGLCLFEMLLGARPWRGPVADIAVAVLRSVPPRVDTRRDDVPAPLAEAIARALSKEPGERFASAGEMSAALRAALSTTMPIVAPGPVPASPRGAPVAAIAALVAALAIGGVAGAVLVASRKPHKAEAPVAQAPPPPSAISSASASDEAPIESATVESETPPDAMAVPARKPSAGPLESVMCNDPSQRFGQLCATPHPNCYCRVRDEDWHALSCAVAWVGNNCPTTNAPPPAPKGSNTGDPCSLHLWQEVDGGSKSWRGPGKVRCEYCNMTDWYRDPPRYGIVGAPCTGVNHFGKTISGRYLRRTN